MMFTYQQMEMEEEEKDAHHLSGFCKKKEKKKMLEAQQREICLTAGMS